MLQKQYSKRAWREISKGQCEARSHSEIPSLSRQHLGFLRGATPLLIYFFFADLSKDVAMRPLSSDED